MGGVAAYVDAEHALDIDYAKKLGVNIEDLLVSQPDTGEQALEIVEILVRSSLSRRLVVSSLTGEQLRLLRDGLASAYPTVADLRQMLRTQLEVNLDDVASGENRLDSIFNLITRWAEPRNQIAALLAAAHADNPDNTDLAAAAQALSRSPVVPTPAPVAPPLARPRRARTAPATSAPPLLPSWPDLDEIGNPELLTKARELRSALQQDEPDVEHVTELRRWFAGRPGRARTAAATFFNTPIVRQIIADATTREYGG